MIGSSGQYVSAGCGLFTLVILPNIAQGHTRTFSSHFEHVFLLYFQRYSVIW